MSDCRDKRRPVVALGEDDAPVPWHAVETVREIEPFAVIREAVLENGPGLHEPDGVPAHVGHLEGRLQAEARHPAREDAETPDPALLGLVEEGLHPEADAEERPV